MFKPNIFPKLNQQTCFTIKRPKFKNLFLLHIILFERIFHNNIFRINPPCIFLFIFFVANCISFFYCIKLFTSFLNPFAIVAWSTSICVFKDVIPFFHNMKLALFSCLCFWVYELIEPLQHKIQCIICACSISTS